MTGVQTCALPICSNSYPSLDFAHYFCFDPCSVRPALGTFAADAEFRHGPDLDILSDSDSGRTPDLGIDTGSALFEVDALAIGIDFHSDSEPDSYFGHFPDPSYDSDHSFSEHLGADIAAGYPHWHPVL